MRHGSGECQQKISTTEGAECAEENRNTGHKDAQASSGAGKTESSAASEYFVTFGVLGAFVVFLAFLSFPLRALW